ncbi:CCN family member 2-like [Tenrec ecaudatus]|uniref:CCN family member 2-like n=1 Tax=Tenrec ecaudatus TaxID=94439 RepID=UPI003F592D0D
MSSPGMGSLLFLVFLLVLCICVPKTSTVLATAEKEGSLILRPQLIPAQRARGQNCGGPCNCDSKPKPYCRPGVTVVKDACNCCPMCAKQLGESCEWPDRCDHKKLLYCDLGTPPNRKTGVCKSRAGAPCYFKDKVYKHGETFQWGCGLKGTCAHRFVVFQLLCPRDLGPPSSDCLFPRRVKPPGKCCEEWVCEEPKELTRAGTNLATFQQDPITVRPKCDGETTDWSPCTTTCGLGVSTRVFYHKANCSVETQKRLCIIRPCNDYLEKEISVGKWCIPSINPAYPINVHVFGCTSLKTYDVKICGICTDGRCCTPSNTSTLPVDFRCPDGKIIKQNMMFINDCTCHYNCH